MNKVFEKVFSSKNRKKDTTSVQYENIPTVCLTDDQLSQCATLFSENYGNYSKKSNIRPGERVRLGVKYYQENYVREGYSVALAIDNKRIIGQAFYIRNEYYVEDKPEKQKMTWVVQLVVDKNYRRKGIAGTLLRSIWGFSDDYAWGLATANPCTVKTLESATMRKCKPQIIEKHQRDIYKIGKDIGFVTEGSLEITKLSSQINSHFDVDNSGFDGVKDCEERLGVLKPGREWLAFTFQQQGIQPELYEKKFPELIRFSEKQLRDAYERMPIEEQGWAKGAPNEVSYIMKYMTNLDDASVVDLGCGVGRHAIELAKRNIKVTGVDFSKRHIEYAREQVKARGIIGCDFICDDVRTFESNQLYDVAICLFDVIGSFPNEEDNISIIRKAHDIICEGGLLILSVMNMELTEAIVSDKHKGDVMHDSKLLLDLQPSSIMQRSGNVFNPNHMVIDTVSRLVYRKEQFSDDNRLSAEYVIRDKRYTMPEIVGLLENEGFSVIDKRYGSSGHFDEPLGATDSHAKEIIVVAKKE